MGNKSRMKDSGEQARAVFRIDQPVKEEVNRRRPQGWAEGRLVKRDIARYYDILQDELQRVLGKLSTRERITLTDHISDVSNLGERVDLLHAVIEAQCPKSAALVEKIRGMNLGERLALIDYLECSALETKRASRKAA